jgi:hypothetical protein
MKYRVQLVNSSGKVVDESAELVSAKDAIGLIRAWESITGGLTPDAPELATPCPDCGRSDGGHFPSLHPFQIPPIR